jgi:hypothetical protein
MAVRRLGVALVLCLAGVPSIAHAGAWTKDQYHFYLQVGTSFTFASERYDEDGKQIPIVARKFTANPFAVQSSNFQQLLTDLYFEYGLLDRLTVFGDFPFLSSMRQMNPGGDIKYSVNYIGDLMLGLRVKLVEAPLIFSLETRFTFPTGDPNKVIPTGNGDFRGELRALGAKTWTWGILTLALDGEFGFTERGNAQVVNPLLAGGMKQTINYAPELSAHGEAALVVRFEVRGRLTFDAAADYRGSTTRTDTDDPSAAFTLIPANSSLTTVTGTILWSFWRFQKEHEIGIAAHYTQAVTGSRLPALKQAGGAVYIDY